MPEIKNQFTGGKMNKDVNERLIPKGEYRDAMNVQVSTSEGSDVGTVQNILGNTPGCTYTGHYQNMDPILPGSTTVGSVSDEKNDSLYWLVAGPPDEVNLPVKSSVSFKDTIMRTNKHHQTGCEPVFVDVWKHCTSVEPIPGYSDNSISLIDIDSYDIITPGMYATGYSGASASPEFPSTLVTGIGAYNTIPLNFNVEGVAGPGYTPPPIDISSSTNTSMFIRGFWNDYGGHDGNGGFTDIQYNASSPIFNRPYKQKNLPPDGASQFWIPLADLSSIQTQLIQQGVEIGNPGGPLPNISPQAYHANNQGASVLNGSAYATVYSTVQDFIFDQNAQGTPALIITVGYADGPVAPFDSFSSNNGMLHGNWSEQNGTTHGGSWPTGIWQKDASIAAGVQQGEGYPFYELQAGMQPLDILAGTLVPTSSFNIPYYDANSLQWIDEIFQILFDFDGVSSYPPAQDANGNPVQLQVSSSLFPVNSCIDPNSVIDPNNGFNIGPPMTFSSTFNVVDCDTGVPNVASGFNVNNSQLELNATLAGNIVKVWLHDKVNLSNTDSVCFESERVLNFNLNQDITGINIMDDMLFWTDNITEPKKINIERSIEGTKFDGTQHTRLINSAQGINIYSDIMAREKHVTVIKSSPRNSLNLELFDGRDPLFNYTGITYVGLDSINTKILDSSNPTVELDFSTLKVGDTVSFSMHEDYYLANTPMDFAWEEGGYLLLKELASANTLLPIPLTDWTIRGLITEWQYNKFDNLTSSYVRVEIEVVGLNGTPLDPDPNDPSSKLYYAVDYEDTEPVIFEDKFPRFSYRYKYEDGEYSAFAPWSSVAFLPKGFDYDPTRGWNTGMLNNIKSLKIKGFQPSKYWNALSKDQDVVEVDILYKEDASPNVYLIETISPTDTLTAGQLLPPWYADEYLIQSETIKSVISSNQLLRPWDNVPKKALAQDISGNRLIYANYEQNYDLKIGKLNYKPDFKNTLTAWSSPKLGTPNKSIKSLRDYKLGVVFTDKYGRETPVLISDNGGFKVDKTDSTNANRLKVGLSGSVPSQMRYYKFYIKETSSEYYNLAMDRWYKAEDGNLWLAFPSSDRNKVDLETSLYFKRGEDDDKNVLSNDTKYKILAIENEAPEFIKTRKIQVGTVEHYYGSSDVFGDGAGNHMLNAPAINGVSFDMDFVGGNFGGTSLSNMEDIKEDLYIQFVSSNDSSAKYKISEITSDRVDETADSGVKLPSKYNVTIDTNFKNDIGFIFNNAASPDYIVDGTKVVFTKAVVENKPQFDGRFFAKIQNDGKIKTQITDDSIGVNYIESAFKMVYAMDHDDLLKTTSSAAVVSNPSFTTQANKVLMDYGADNQINHPNAIATSASPWPDILAQNPGFINFNHLAARNSYFQRGNNIATNSINLEYSPAVFNNKRGWKWNGDTINQLFYPELSNSSDGNGGSSLDYNFNVSQNDTGVWFIDRSTKKYKLTTTGGDDNELDWPAETNMNHVESPKCSFATQCGYTSASGSVGRGIENNSGNNTSTVNLGFGGFGGVTGWEPDVYLTPDWFFSLLPNVLGYSTTAPEYFGVGTTNTNWQDSSTTKFVGALEAGFSFKWKEDPTETIYKIEGQTSYQKNLRFGRQDDSYHHNDTDLIGALSSYTKTFTFNVTPSMDHWDPAAPPGTYLDENGGKGLVLGDGVLYGRAIGGGTTVASGDSTIYLADISDLQIGMSVMATNIPKMSKITGINQSFDTVNGGYPVNIDLLATGSITNGVNVNFGFTIRIVEDHVFGSAVNLTEPRNNYIVVDRDSAECSNGNTLKPVYSLKKGMALHSYNVDSTLRLPSHPVVIEKIEPHTSGYKITLAGYHSPMNYDSGANFSDNFVLKERLVFKQISMNGASNFTEQNTRSCQINAPVNNASFPLGMISAVGYNMTIVEAVDEYADGGNLPENPFVWETEPKEDDGLDIYYEISENLPTVLNQETAQHAIPKYSKVRSASGEGGLWTDVWVTFNGGPSGRTIQISELVWMGPGNAPDGTLPIESGSLLRITKPNGIEFSVAIDAVVPHSITPNVSKEFKIKGTLHQSNYRLNWHNCYSFGNGVESNRIKDTFNSPFISNGVKVSTTLDEVYKKERRTNGLIYSGIYNSTSGVNNLNQFIQAEKITKDINPIYGSIQKLHAGWGQGGDLIALCEDRILKILANKDALFNADGNVNVTSTNSVLGQAIPYSGEYGISKNPQSFASEAYRAYFTDKVRGAVMRLSIDGLTPISDHGMKDWFRDHLKLSDKLTGSYDDKKDEYNITLSVPEKPTTVTFKENVKGWVSFKSFVPENAISCANEYYTFLGGKLWEHHAEQVDRNTFYGTDQQNYTKSNIKTVFNELPGTVKSFKTVSYEGSQARITKETGDNEYFNLSNGDGWYVQKVVTNLEQGGITEFIKKEGKWFGYIVGDDVTHNQHGNVSGNYNTEDFSIQGIGRTINVNASITFGCTDATMFNYDPAATNDDGSCIAIVNGCTDISAVNYNALANTNDGSCSIFGCTTGPLAVWNNPFAGGSTNFNSNATSDDGSCIQAVWGCTDATAINYDPLATIGSGLLNSGQSCGYENCMCTHTIHGCTDSNASNFLPLVDETVDVNTDDGSCIYYGCTDAGNSNYSFSGSGVDSNTNSYAYLNGTAVDDGTCSVTPGVGCTDSLACNYDSTASIDDGSCYTCGDDNAVNYDAVPPLTDYTCLGTCTYCEDVASVTVISQTTADAGQSNGTVTIEWPASASATSYGVSGSGGGTVIPSGNPTETYTVTGLAAGTYTIEVMTTCLGGSLIAGLNLPGGNIGTPAFIGTSVSTTITATPVPGCTDAGGTGTSNPNGSWAACNYNNAATVDDGTCEYTTCTGCMTQGYAEFCNTCWDAVNQVEVTDGSGGDWSGELAGDCATVINGGCTTPGQFNYLAAYNADCSDVVGGNDTSCCIPVINGCLDDTLNNDGSYATNYNDNANTDTGCNPYSCPNIHDLYWGGGAPDWTGDQVVLSINNLTTPYSFITDIIIQATIGGTTVAAWDVEQFDPTVGIKTLGESVTGYYSNGDTSLDVAVNVTTADGNCAISSALTLSIGCTDNTADSFDNFDISDNTQCEYTDCMDPVACNNNPNATIADNSLCTYCSDPDASNYDGATNNCVSGCEYVGCTDSTPQTDGSGFAAINFNSSFTTACNSTDASQTANYDGFSSYDSNQDNDCCDYTIPGDQEIAILVYPDTNDNTAYSDDFSKVGIFYNVGNTAYTEGEANNSITIGTAGDPNVNSITQSGNVQLNLNADSLLGPPVNNFNTVFNYVFNGQDAWPVGNDTTGLPFDWTLYVNDTTTPATLDIVVNNATFNGSCNNPSINNALPQGLASKTAQFTVGCKFQTWAANYDPSVDLNMPSSCIQAFAGCIDPDATNFNSSANADCTFAPISSISANGCCCYTCDQPAWATTNAVVADNWTTDTNTPPFTYPQQLTFSFDAISNASGYTINWTNQAQTSSGTIVNNVAATISGSTASIVYVNNNNTIFNDGDVYIFNVKAHCSNDDSDNCGHSAASFVTIQFNE